MEGIGDLMPDYTGKSLTIDQVLVRTLDRLSHVSTKPYTTDLERRLKYMALLDVLKIVIMPLLEPKIIGTEEWYAYYKNLKEKLGKPQNTYEVETFSNLLSEFMGLCSTVMYSTGVYDPVRINADQFEAMHKAGLI